MFRTKLALTATLVTLITAGTGCITDDTETVDADEPEVVAAPPSGEPRTPDDEPTTECRFNNKPTDDCPVPE